MELIQLDLDLSERGLGFRKYNLINISVQLLTIKHRKQNTILYYNKVTFPE